MTSRGEYNKLNLLAPQIKYNVSARASYFLNCSSWTSSSTNHACNTSADRMAIYNLNPRYLSQDTGVESESQKKKLGNTERERERELREREREREERENASFVQRRRVECIIRQRCNLERVSYHSRRIECNDGMWRRWKATNSDRFSVRSYSRAKQTHLSLLLRGLVQCKFVRAQLFATLENASVSVLCIAFQFTERRLN